MLADVALARPLPAPLTYLVPEDWLGRVAAGSRVVAPLSGALCEGIVVRLRDEPPAAGMRVRPLAELLGEEPALTPELLELAEWMAEYYVACPGEALGAMVHPYAPPQAENWLRLVLGRIGRVKPGGREAKVIAWLDARGGTGPGRLARLELGPVADAIPAMVRKGVLVREERAAATPAPVEFRAEEFPALNDEQVRLHEAIAASIDRKEAAVHLVQGVTGSGKTELYLHLIRHVLAGGGGAIFLVPEISLTVPMIALFRERFGPRMALFHSALTPSERYREWVSVRRGEARVVVGARSAVFAPVAGLGIVVIDEEAETSYKQQERPCYHARDVAVARGRIAGFPVVLGSATPCLESLHAGRGGRFRHHRLNERFNRQPLPAVELVDMTVEFTQRRNRSIFSWRLRQEMETTLAEGRQALLFVNRRGHSTYVFCRACGFVLECHQCSVSLTFHQLIGTCRCHQCGFEQTSPERCPSCASTAFRFAGLGTQKVEEETRLNFPGVSCQRMDSDTTSKRGSHQRIYDDFAAGRTQVLIGTQMAAKGFNFPSLDLVGVINADVALRLPDFRSAERTFQLVTQVAGRVGRAERPGRVLVQTFAPAHHALVHAAGHDLDGFAAAELPGREELFYPPFSALILVGAEAEDELAPREALAGLRDALAAALPDAERHQVLGPARAPLALVKGRHRWQLLLKLEPGGAGAAAARRVLAGWSAPSPVSARVDVDPLRMT
ncbi:MAG: primosomal protein N' [Candidatus Wallbacteria bacterium]|nr:primosomal protein N' [Candidatus Wallbacteria bacterium]